MHSPDLKTRIAPILPLVGGFFALMGVGFVFPAFAGVIDLALPFFGLIGLGYICGRLFDFGEEGLAWVNVFIIYAGLCGEENATPYQGNSVIVGPDGEDIARAGMDDTLLLAAIDPARYAGLMLDPYLSDRRPELYGKLV